MRIPKGILKIGRCASQDAEVKPISTVRVARTSGDRCTAEVTDGRAAIRIIFMEPASVQLFGYGVDDSPIDGIEQLIPGEVAIQSDKAIAKDPGYAVLDEKPVENQIAMIVPGAAQQQRWDAPVVTGIFPPIEDVIRNYVGVDIAKGSNSPIPCAVVAINPDLFIQTLKALHEATADVQTPVLMEVPLLKGSPIQLRRGRYRVDGVEAVGVLMPMGDDCDRRRVGLIDGTADPEPQPPLPGMDAPASGLVSAESLAAPIKEYFGESAMVTEGPGGVIVNVNIDDMPVKKKRKAAVAKPK